MVAQPANVYPLTSRTSATFRDLLRRHRDARRWSQERLASESEIDHSLVSRLESGQRNPTQEAIAKLAIGLELTEAQHDALLAAAGFLPQRREGAIADEPDVAALYRLLRDERVPEARKADMRVMVRGLVRIANQEG